MEKRLLDQDVEKISDDDIKKIQSAVISEWSRPMTADELFNHNAVVLGNSDGINS